MYLESEDYRHSESNVTTKKNWHHDYNCKNQARRNSFKNSLTRKQIQTIQSQLSILG